MYFITRTIERTRWSAAGFVHCWKEEYSFRAWGYCNVVSAVLAFVLPLTGGERALILALGLLVMVVELINTAVERAVDHTSTEHHPLAGQAKDTASAAVMLTAMAAGVAWIVALIW